MSHPVLIITHDPKQVKDAVDQLKGAGIDVRVIDTVHAKLIDMLTALAGLDDETKGEKKDEDGKKDEEAKEDKGGKTEEHGKDADKEEADLAAIGDKTAIADADKSDSEKQVTEAVVFGETVKVVLVEGAELTLLPREVVSTPGGKTVFTISEGQQISAWQVSTTAVINDTVAVNGHAYRASTVQVSTKSAPVATLLVGREWLKA